MRLTEKINGRYYGKANNHIASKPLMEKLGQLEDYEDKLKIDLLRGLEAMNKGCYAYYADDKEPAFIEPDDIKIMRGGIAVGFYPEEWNHNKRMSGQMCHFGCPFENYGKTWALTKEELL